jgi:hypothetical protein
MASSIAAITTGIGGVVTTADNSGSLDIKSGTTTIVSITSAGAAVTGNLTASSLTSGRVTFASTAGLLADSSSFTYNGSQLNLTGTAYGGLNLQSRTDAAQVSASLFFTTSTSGNYLMRGDTGSLAFLSGAIIGSNGGTERMRLDSSGNLGLGVTPSAWSSSFRAYELTGGALYSGSPTAVLVAQNFYFNGTNNIYKTTNPSTAYSQNAGVHSWLTAASGTAGNAITFTQAMTLDASSNLTVNGYVMTDGFSSPTTRYYSLRSGYAPNASGGVGMMAVDLGTGNSDGLRLSGNQGILFSTGATERMRITSGGNLGVGTANPQARLDLGLGYGPNGAKCLFYNDGGGELDATKVGIYMDRFSEANSVTMLFPSSVGNPGRYHVAYKDTTNTTIVDVCYVGRTSTSWTFPSDERIKDIECEVTGALDILKGIRTVYYTLKRDPNKTRKIGMIAQDWLKVLPEVVEIPSVEFDFDKAEGHLALASSDTISVLVKAIQEQQAMIEELKAEIDLLKGVK